MNLNTEHPNVPSASEPVWWDLNRTNADNIREMERWIGYYSDRLPVGTAIDEVSILTTRPGMAAKRLEEADWALFNRAEDVVFTNPFGTRYTVMYDFYRHPLVPWRLEVMRTKDGFSPLHRALSQVYRTDSQMPVPHLSFKPEQKASPIAGKEGFRRSYGRAIQQLQDKGCLHVMTCQSTYGVFGYFIGNDVGRQVYVKPRINLRDEETS